MRAGRLKHLVTLQSPTGSQDAVGQRTTTWIDEAQVYADIIPLKADTRIAAAQGRMSTTHRVRLRHSPISARIDGSWRIYYDDRIFTIDSVINVDERDREFELLCTEGLKDG